MAANWGLGVLLFCFICSVSSYSEPGVYELTLNKDARIGDFQRSMYNNTKIIVKLDCDDAVLDVKWWLWKADCLLAFQSVDNSSVDHYKTLGSPHDLPNSATYVASGYQVFNCDADHPYVVSKEIHEAPEPTKATPKADTDTDDSESKGSSESSESPAASSTTSKGQPPAKPGDEASKAPPVLPPVQPETPPKTPSKKKRQARNIRSKRAATENKDEEKKEIPEENKKDPAGVEATAGPLVVSGGKQSHPDDKEVPALYTTKSEAIYFLVIEISTKTEVAMNVQMKRASGYLSPIDWPKLPFYGTMCVLYVLYGIVWLVMLAMNWRDLLRVQFWVGAVILLGMLEKAVYFGEFESINTTGLSVSGALIFAELVSALKRTLARMLVIIVSLGYGIVKPRLGADQNKVVGIGILFFILSSIEGCLRVAKKSHSEKQNGKDLLVLLFLITLLEVYICYWIFTSLVQTTRVLRLRRNVVKLSLYRHFTNTLVFAVLASLAFMIWSMSKHRFVQCLDDWKELWVDDAFWHMLFCVILLVIIILWRPSINNQRYAFSPLLDPVEEEDEDDETPISDAFDGMNKRPRDELRNVKHPEKKKDKVDDDLKWIDENIPASVADAALPSLLDSDEEIVTTKFEVSKME